jgi:hypothetical protein
VWLRNVGQGRSSIFVAERGTLMAKDLWVMGLSREAETVWALERGCFVLKVVSLGKPS